MAQPADAPRRGKPPHFERLWCPSPTGSIFRPRGSRSTWLMALKRTRMPLTALALAAFTQEETQHFVQALAWAEQPFEVGNNGPTRGCPEKREASAFREALVPFANWLYFQTQGQPLYLVDGAQADAHAADRTGTRRFHSRRDAALRAGACMGRAAIRGGEQWPNPRMPREEGSLRISRGSGALRQLALFSDPGAAALPG